MWNPTLAGETCWLGVYREEFRPTAFEGSEECFESVEVLFQVIIIAVHRMNFYLNIIIF